VWDFLFVKLGRILLTNITVSNEYFWFFVSSGTIWGSAVLVTALVNKYFKIPVAVKRDFTLLLRPGKAGILGALFGIGLGFITYACGAFTSIGRTTPPVIIPLSSLWIPASLLGIYLIGAMGEELMWRSTILNLLEARFGSLVALLLSAVGFGCWHVVSDWDRTLQHLVLAALFGGLPLGAWYIATRKYYVAVGIHCGFNLALDLISGNHNIHLQPLLLRQCDVDHVNPHIFRLIVTLFALAGILVAHRRGNWVPRGGVSRESNAPALSDNALPSAPHGFNQSEKPLSSATEKDA